MTEILAHSRGPRRTLSTRSSFSWAFAGNVFYSATQWGMLVLLARAGTTAAVGQFTYALAVTAPIVLLLTGRNVQVTDTEHRHSTRDYLEQRLWGVAGTTAVIAALSFLLPTDPTTASVILLVGVAKGVECIADVFHGLFHQNNRLDIVTKSLAIRGTLSVTAFGACFAAAADLTLACAALAVAWLVTLFAFDLPQARQFSRAGWMTKGKPGSLRALWKLTLPLGLSATLWSFVPNSPRYVIESSLGHESLGVFSALAYLLVISRTVGSAVASALMPRMARLWHAGDTLLFTTFTLRILALMVLLSLALVLLAWVGGKPLVTIIYGPEYARDLPLILWLTVAAGLQQAGTIMTAALSAAQSFRSLTLANAGALVTVTIAAPTLIPEHGLRGGAWAICLGMTIPLLIKALALRGAMRGLDKGTEIEPKATVSPPET